MGTSGRDSTCRGRASVWMFFGLSGYVIGHGFFSGRYAFDREGVKRFYLRRASRILPLFWLTSVIALVASLGGLVAFDWSVENLIAALFMLQWSHMTYPVGVFWTLGIEMQFYLVAPVLCWAVVKAGRYWPGVGVAAILALCWHFGDRPDLRTLSGVIMFFLAGILMARWAICFPSRQRLWAFHSYLALGFVCLMVASDAYPDRFWNHVGPVFVLLALVFLLRAHAVLEKRQIPAGLATRLLMIVGALAYGLYAWHGLLMVVWPPFQDTLLLTYTASLVLAWLSFTLMERPIIRRFTTQGGARFEVQPTIGA